MFGSTDEPLIFVYKMHRVYGYVCNANVIKSKTFKPLADCKV